MAKTLDSCRTANDFERYARKHGARIVRCKKGIKVYGPDGREMHAVIHNNHPKELATGTRCALVKTFIAIGLAGMLGCAWIYQAMMAMQV